MTADDDLMDTGFHFQRFAQMREAIRPHEAAFNKGEPLSFSISAIIARGSDGLLCLGDMGKTWPAGAYTAVGSGSDIANYLLPKLYRPDMTIGECLAMAAHIIAEVASVNVSVGPPLVWADTVDLRVRTAEG